MKRREPPLTEDELERFLAIAPAIVERHRGTFPANFSLSALRMFKRGKRKPSAKQTAIIRKLHAEHFRELRSGPDDLIVIEADT